MVRGFAEYLRLLEPRTEVPPQKLIPFRVHRPEPYLYSDKQVLQLIGAARQIDPRHKIKGLTLGTLFGLLAVTGMRVGEALALDREDIAFAEALLTIRWAKGKKSRLVPLHPSTVEALQRYARLRDEIYPRPIGRKFFVWDRGAPLRYQMAWEWFRVAACQAGLPQLGGGRVRKFALTAHVTCSVGWLGAVAAYVHVSDTYWYLSAVPELLQLATRRWERAEKGGK